MPKSVIKPAEEVLPPPTDWEEVGEQVTCKISRRGHMFRSSRGGNTIYGWSIPEIKVLLKHLEKAAKEGKSHG